MLEMSIEGDVSDEDTSINQNTKVKVVHKVKALLQIDFAPLCRQIYKLGVMALVGGLGFE